jgi:outer membrane receptor protein involved in Fe transport
MQRGQSVADLDPERLDSIELGLRGYVAGTMFDTALFAMRKHNVVFQDSAGFAVSDGRTTHRGLELSLHRPLGEAFEFSLAGTLARHRYDFDRAVGAGDVIVRGNEVDTAPRRLGTARLGWRPGVDSRIELEAVHVGAHWLDAANLHRYGGHTLLNLRGRHAFGDGWSFGWRVTNLTDRRYAERADFAFGDYRYFPGPPRTAFISVRYTDN